MESSVPVEPQSNKARRNKRRLIRHYLPLSLAAGLIIFLFVTTLPSEDTIWRWSMATAYAGLALLGFTLLVGAIHVLRSRPNPVSSDLTRDAGIVAAVVSLVHVGVGLFVHLGNPWLYFFFPAEENRSIPLRYDAFGLTNWLGLAVTLILIVLFATSNDLSLRRLGVKRWKTLQRMNYFLFGGMALHGVVYQLLEKRNPPLMLLLAATVGIVVVIQLAGYMKRRKELEEKRKPG